MTFCGKPKYTGYPYRTTILRLLTPDIYTDVHTLVPRTFISSYSYTRNSYHRTISIRKKCIYLERYINSIGTAPPIFNFYTYQSGIFIHFFFFCCWSINILGGANIIPITIYIFTILLHLSYVCLLTRSFILFNIKNIDINKIIILI